MENFIPDQLNENIVYEQFDYIKSTDGALELYHYYTALPKLEAEKAGLYFECRESKRSSDSDLSKVLQFIPVGRFGNFL